MSELADEATFKARRLLTTDEAAAFLCLSPRTLERWRVEGRGPLFNKLGGAVRYDSRELERFAAEASRRSTADLRR